MKYLEKLCIPCMFVGSALFLLALEAAAADASVQHAAITWRDLALAAVGLLMAIVGAFAKGQQARIDKLEQQLSKLIESINLDARSRAVESHRLSTLENGIRAIHKRLDYFRANQFGVPQTPDED